MIPKPELLPFHGVHAVLYLPTSLLQLRQTGTTWCCCCPGVSSFSAGKFKTGILAIVVCGQFSFGASSVSTPGAPMFSFTSATIACRQAVFGVSGILPGVPDCYTCNHCLCTIPCPGDPCGATGAPQYTCCCELRVEGSDV